MKKINFTKNFLLLAVVVLLTSTITTSVSAAGVGNNVNMDEEEKEMLEVFSAIESLPDSVIEQGNDAVLNWLKINTDIEIEQQGEYVTFGIVGCSSAVGLAILTNAIPIAKLAKVKAAIKSAGGAKTFVKTLVPAYKAARKAGSKKGASVKAAVSKAASNAGPETKRALLDLFNVGNVYSACFE